MRYVSKFVLFHGVWETGSQKGSNYQKWPSRSFSDIGNGAICEATYNFLLVFHHNCICILQYLWDIITYFPKFKEVTWLWTCPFWGNMSSVH